MSCVTESSQLQSALPMKYFPIVWPQTDSRLHVGRATNGAHIEIC
jgi:hypothetical protein